MNKICTSIEQSKKLIELGIDTNTADMYYHNRVDIPDNFPLPIKCKHNNPLLSQEIPAWSLAALLSILPTVDDRNAIFCKDIRYDKWHVYYHSTAILPIIDTDRYENLVDTCVEMILKLHELEKL